MVDESTSPDLVELGRQVNDAAERRDFDAMMSFFGPAPVWDLSPMGLGVYEGVAAIRGFFEDWIGSYDDFKLGGEELLDLGSGIVFTVLVQRGRPIGSSGEVTIRYASVSVWDEGSMVRITNYNDIDEARAAAERLMKERADG